MGNNNRNRRLGLGFEGLEDRRLLATDFELLRDINQDLGARDSFPDTFIQAGSQVLFRAITQEEGRELWKTDGTEAGTQLVKDIFRGSGSSLTQVFTTLNDRLYFQAFEPEHGFGLWSSDGTSEGTQFISNAVTSSELISAHGRLYLSGDDAAGNWELWTSDGTATGTGIVKDIWPGEEDSKPDSLTAVGQSVFFAANDGTSGVELWKTDGTEAGTVLVKDIRAGEPGSFPQELTNVGGILYFTTLNPSDPRMKDLWRSDGTEQGTLFVKTIDRGNQRSFQLTDVGGNLFFVARDAINGFELWKSDGSEAGTRPVADINPGLADSSPSWLTSDGSRLFFSAYDSTHGRELWVSDGTAQGTNLVRDIAPNAANASPAELVALGGSIYFTIGRELWRSDGTENGTTLVRAFDSVTPYGLTAVAGEVYFRDRQFSASEVWKTDGSEAGTVLVKAIRAGNGDARIDEPTDVAGTLFFEASAEQFGSGLWKSDGTRAGTTLVKDVMPHDLTNVNGTLFFESDAGTPGAKLWKSDGTEAGTVLVKEVAIQEGTLAEADGTLFFAADSSGNGTELWRSDGTEAGTMQLKDIRPGTAGSGPDHLTNVNGTLYFTARGEDSLLELWKSDGTEAGTVQVKDLAPGSTSSVSTSFAQFVAVGSTLFFHIQINNGSYDLWRSDGTAGGTRIVRSFEDRADMLTDVAGTLLFRGRNGSRYELWRSDGTEAGTALVGEVSPDHLTDVQGTLFFEASVPGEGSGLWRSDGTSEGTFRVKDIGPGDESGRLSDLINVQGTLYFRALNEFNAYALWRSDGTEAGTVPVVDASGQSIEPVLIAQADGKVFFTVPSNEIGEELHRLFEEVDFGDASTLTAHAEDGARHVATGPRLGQLRDSIEADGIASPGANSDDLDGVDDEDGLLSVSQLSPNQVATLDIEVRDATDQTLLDVWMDWNQDGDWDDANEQVAVGQSVSSGIFPLVFNVPVEARLGSTTARMRISEESGLGPTGFAFSGEVEDHLVDVLEDLEIQLGDGPNQVAIRKSGDRVEVVDLTSSAVLGSRPLAETNTLRVFGSDAHLDDLFIDFAGGGFFALPGGIEVVGGTGPKDRLTITGTGQTDSVYSTLVAPTGPTQLTVSEAGESNPIRYDGFDDLTFDTMFSFSATSTLSIHDGSLTIGSATPIDLSSLTVIEGGSLSSGNTIVLGGSETLVGYGTVAGRFLGETGSLVELSGVLHIGDPTSPDGFNTLGEVQVGSHALVLMDSTQATLGISTTIGHAGVGGSITAANGLSVGTSSSLSGYGTVITPEVAANALVNQGAIAGNSAEERITLTGFVTGTGMLDHVRLTGTLSPGPSPVVAQLGDMTYSSGSTTRVEIAGATPGSSGHDQLNHVGNVVLNGALHVQLIDNYAPAPGTVFDIITWTGSATGDLSGYKGQLLTSSIAILPWLQSGRLSMVSKLFGDANADGAITNSDIPAFLLALTNPSDYAVLYPVNDPDIVLDFNADGRFTNADIPGFVALLTGP